MVWAEKFKLNKQLIKSINEAGFSHPKEIQLKTLNRIIGGQDVIGVGPKGCGKTITYVLGTLNRFNYKADSVPRVLILSPSPEKILEIIAAFKLFNRNTSIRIAGLHTAAGIEQQMDDLADGADIVVAMPDRARAIYLKLGLNLNKVDFFVVDDAQQIIKQGLQLSVIELANSIGKSQRLVFTEVMHDKLQKMIAPFMHLPTIVKVDELPEAQLQTHQQLLYHIPNFGTKLNLLNLFMYDEELFTKTVVFTNTRLTAEKLYTSLHNRLRKAVAILNPLDIDQNHFKNIDDFKQAGEVRVLIIANENTPETDISGIPFIIHFELPASQDVFINHVLKQELDDEETLAITFATDLELDQVKRIEQATGQKMQIADLPDDLIIEKERKEKIPGKENRPVKADPNVYTSGEAFHEKKPENAKTYNYSSGTKAKMNKKRKH